MWSKIFIPAIIGLAIIFNGCSCPNSKSYRVAPDLLFTCDSLLPVIDEVVRFNLVTALAESADGDTLILENGFYFAYPDTMIEPLCGNCPEHLTDVMATIGFVIKDKSLTVIGEDKDSTVLITGAGYGIYIENAPEVNLIRLKITGGVRDSSGAATDAGVVVRASRVYLNECSITDNDNRCDSVVVGIGGVFGREGAEIFLSDCGIVNNGWDGVALYRGSGAVVRDCIIKKGRGAGIGVTWDAWCVAERNQVSEFWKGIGSFGTSRVTAHNNLVFDNLGWGIIATGQSFMDAANNVVYHNGNCGMAPWSEECRGRFVNNIIVANGWRDEWVCPCVGIWNYGNLGNWQIYNNLVWNNKAGNYGDMPDLTGKDGNLAVDPMFVGDGDFHLQEGSPAVDAGYGEITDHDGSPSDLGIYGGTAAEINGLH